jgi:hypothetical protein
VTSSMGPIAGRLIFTPTLLILVFPVIRGGKWSGVEWRGVVEGIKW